MKNNSSLILWLFASFSLLLSCSHQKRTGKPNVVLIFTDDQGSMDLGCYGAKDLETPNLDKLATEGVRFTQFYVGAPVCSPSRAALLTGKTPQEAGLVGNASSSHEGHVGMPTEQVTIAEMMRGAGYKTAHIGKWHLGYSPETMPNGQGFDYSFGFMGGCIDNFGHFFYWNGPNRHDLWENGKEIFEDGDFFPKLMTAKASEFIQKNKNEPFFMYYAINTPHYPLQPYVHWRERYKDMEMPRRDYAAFVSTTDEEIGNLINVIDQAGIRENTIIIYLSDHGHSYETRTFGSGGYSGPYRGGKFSLFEGGIRVPAIISWKGQLGQNEVIDKLCMSMDILPTIASLCGIEKIPVGVEGYDFSDIIRQGTDSHHELIRWQFGKQWAVRKGDWKLVGNPRDPSDLNSINPEKDSLFLSDLSKDISESKNLVEENPNKINELLDDYLSWEYADRNLIPEKYRGK